MTIKISQLKSRSQQNYPTQVIALQSILFHSKESNLEKAFDNSTENTN